MSPLPLSQVIHCMICSLCHFVLRRPHASSHFHRHSFAVSAPTVWNNIPVAVRDSVSLDAFKTAFKTYLCNSAYTPRHWQWSIGTSDSLLVTYGSDQTNTHDWLTVCVCLWILTRVEQIVTETCYLACTDLLTNPLFVIALKKWTIRYPMPQRTQK